MEIVFCFKQAGHKLIFSLRSEAHHSISSVIPLMLRTSWVIYSNSVSALSVGFVHLSSLRIYIKRI